MQAEQEGTYAAEVLPANPKFCLTVSRVILYSQVPFPSKKIYNLP